MKKLISVIIALALLAVCCTAFADDAAETAETKEKIQFFVPATLAEYGLEDLPLDQFPTIKTKRVSKITTITVTGKPDKLYANWMGYGESPEEVILKDGVGKISSEGHKYSVGTHYVTGSPAKYIDERWYAMDEVPQAEAEADLKAAHAKEVDSGAYIVNEPLEGYFVYYMRDSWYEKDGWAYSVDYDYKEFPTIYKTKSEAQAAAQSMGGNKYTEVYSAEYGTTVYTWEGYGVWSYGGYSLLMKGGFKYSNGWPNRAYTVKQGEYSVDYTRGGETNYASRIMDSDLFETGIEGAKSTINWEIYHKKNGPKTIVTGISTSYPKGSPIGSISVSFKNDKVYRYTVTYNMNEHESYICTYTAKDKFCGATYTRDGMTIAKSSAKNKWVNCKTKLFEHFLEPLDGDMFRKPARVLVK